MKLTLKPSNHHNQTDLATDETCVGRSFLSAVFPLIIVGPVANGSGENPGR